MQPVLSMSERFDRRIYFYAVCDNLDYFDRHVLELVGQHIDF